MTEQERKFKIGDIVRFASDITLEKLDGSEKLIVDKNKDYEVIFVFNDYNGEEICVLKMDGFDEAFLASGLVLIDRFEATPKSKLDGASKTEVLESFLRRSPECVDGDLYEIDGEIIAAKSLEGAIDIYRELNGDALIDSIKRTTNTHILIQNVLKEYTAKELCGF